MPSIGIQTDLTWEADQGVFSDASPTTPSFSPPSPDSETPSTWELVPQSFRDPCLWPELGLDSGYYHKLGNAHCRWGHKSKAYKHPVAAFRSDKACVCEWARYRFGLFLEERGLEHHLKHTHTGEFPLPGRSVWFDRYVFTNAIPATSGRRTVYHGTYPELFAKIAWTGEK